MWLAQAGDGGWLQRRLAMAEISLSNHIASLAGGEPCAHFWGALFFQGSAGLSSSGGARSPLSALAAFFSGFGWSFIVQLFLVGSAGCSWPPGRPAGCTAPPRSFSRLGWFSRAPQSVRKAPPLPAPQRGWKERTLPPPATAAASPHRQPPPATSISSRFHL